MCFPTQTHGKITSQSPSGQSCLWCLCIHDVSPVPVRTQSPKALWINCTPFRTCLSVFRMLWMRWRPLEREWRSMFSGLTSFLSDSFLQLFVVKLLGVTCDFSLSFSTRSTFNWTVPFLSWLAITALCLATFLLYLIPLRYLVLAWGESWFHNTQTTTHTDKKMLRYVGVELVHEKGSFSYIFVRLQIVYLKIMKYGPGFRGMRSLPF